LAYLIFTLMGVASEHLGLDKELRSNTETRRTHSLFRQGVDLYGFFVSEVYNVISRSFKRLYPNLSISKKPIEWLYYWV
ncbi:MAG: hypothetical protein MIO92_05755, partial [Methanosarcinaceae archaeon]|nr:hypothetical protein [Methanosarcinaceae archaeon]